MTFILAYLALSQASQPLTFEFMIRGGLTDVVSGQYFVSSGLLESLGYRVEYADGKTVKVTSYGFRLPSGTKLIPETKRLPVRPVTVSQNSMNSSGLVSLSSLHPLVKQGMRLSQGHEFTKDPSRVRADSPPVLLWERTTTYRPEPLRNRRWFRVSKKTIPGINALVRVVGLTLGSEESLKTPSLREGFPDTFVSAQLILQFDRERIPEAVSERTLPLEAFTLRTSDGSAFLDRLLVIPKGMKRESPHWIAMPLFAEANPDLELATVISFWIPPDRTPTELVYCDGRTLLRAKLVEFDGPSKSLDPVGLGQDTLTVDNKTFRYEQVFK